MSYARTSLLRATSLVFFIGAAAIASPKSAVAGCVFDANRLCGNPGFRDSHDPAACARILSQYQNLLRESYQSLDRIMNTGSGIPVQAAQGVGRAWDFVTTRTPLPQIRDRLWRIHGRIASISPEIEALKRTQAGSSEFLLHLGRVRRQLDSACGLIEITRNQMVGTGTAYAVRSRNTALAAGVIGSGGGVVVGSGVVAVGGGVSLFVGGVAGDEIFPWRARQRGVLPPLPETSDARRADDEEEAFVEISLEDSASPSPLAASPRRRSGQTGTEPLAGAQNSTQRPRHLRGENPVAAEQALQEIEVSELPAARTRTNRQIARELRDMARSGVLSRDLLELATDREINRTIPSMRPTEGEYTYMLSRFHEALDETIQAHGENNPDWAGLVDAIADRFTSEFFDRNESGTATQNEALGALLGEGANDELRALFMAVALNEIRDRLPSYIQISVEVYQNQVQTVLHDTQTQVVHNPLTWENHDAGVGRLYGAQEIPSAMLRRMTGRSSYSRPRVEERPTEERPELARASGTRRRSRQNPVRSRSDAPGASPAFRWARSRNRSPEQRNPTFASVTEARPPVELSPSAPTPAAEANEDLQSISAGIQVPPMLSREQALRDMQNDVLSQPDRVMPGTLQRLLSLQAATFGGTSRTRYEEAMRHYLTTVEIARRRIQNVSDPIQQERIASQIALQRHMSEYFIDHTRVIHALLGNREQGGGVNCQGDGQFTPGYFADVGIAQVSGQSRGIQLFTDHVQAVRYDSATRTSTTTLTQAVDGTAGRIRSPIMREGYLNFVALRGAGYTEAEIGATMESFVMASADPVPTSNSNPVEALAAGILSPLVLAMQAMGMESNGMDWGSPPGSTSSLAHGGGGGIPLIPRRATRTMTSGSGEAERDGETENRENNGPSLWAQLQRFFSSSSQNDEPTPPGTQEEIEAAKRDLARIFTGWHSSNLRLSHQDRQDLTRVAQEQLLLPNQRPENGYSIFSDARRQRFAEYSEEVVRRSYQALPPRQRQGIENPTIAYRLSNEDISNINSFYEGIKYTLRQSARVLVEPVASAIEDEHGSPNTVDRDQTIDELMTDALQLSPTLSRLAREDLNRLEYARRNPETMATTILRDSRSGVSTFLVHSPMVTMISAGIGGQSNRLDTRPRFENTPFDRRLTRPILRRIAAGEREAAISVFRFSSQNISMTQNPVENDHEEPPQRRQPQIRLFVPAVPPERRRGSLNRPTQEEVTLSNGENTAPSLSRETGHQGDGDTDHPGYPPVTVVPDRPENIRIESERARYLDFLIALTNEWVTRSHLRGYTWDENTAWAAALSQALQPLSTDPLPLPTLEQNKVVFLTHQVFRFIDDRVNSNRSPYNPGVLGNLIASQNPRIDNGVLRLDQVGSIILDQWTKNTAPRSIPEEQGVEAESREQELYQALQMTSLPIRDACRAFQARERELAGNNGGHHNAWAEINCDEIARQLQRRR